MLLTLVSSEEERLPWPGSRAQLPPLPREGARFRDSACPCPTRRALTSVEVPPVLTHRIACLSGNPFIPHLLTLATSYPRVARNVRHSVPYLTVCKVPSCFSLSSAGVSALRFTHVLLVIIVLEPDSPTAQDVPRK